jgi:hypothetical protein
MYITEENLGMMLVRLLLDEGTLVILNTVHAFFFRIE